MTSAHGEWALAETCTGRATAFAAFDGEALAAQSFAEFAEFALYAGRVLEVAGAEPAA